MDWSRRKFVLSTSAVLSLTGCQGLHPVSGSDPAVPSTESTARPDAQTPGTGPTTERTAGESEPDIYTPTDGSTATPTSGGQQPSARLHSGATIPQQPHTPSGVVPPTGRQFSSSDATAVLTASDVTDYGDVDYVADPFIFVEDGTWHMFFEILNSDRYKDAPIGHATSPDGLDWTYDQVVMSNRKHLSFPLVWKHGGEYYTCPPNGTRVELYRAQDFPTDWQHLGKVIDVDFYPHDPTFVRYDGRWWLFTDRGNRHVMVYYNDSLSVSGWTPHPGNPVVTDRIQAARQGGRPIVVGDRLFLYFQDLAAHYGDKIRCYEVTELTPNTYADREAPGSPTLEEFAEPWANRGMHTFDPWWLGPDRGWRCAVDGCTDGSNDWSIGIVDIPP